MTALWIKVVLMIALYLALWAWFAWRLLGWFGEEARAARGSSEVVDEARPARARPEPVEARDHEGVSKNREV